LLNIVIKAFISFMAFLTYETGGIQRTNLSSVDIS